jgi:1-acyl-sn-glycerol-3-phosphate acyltransferase
MGKVDASDDVTKHRGAGSPAAEDVPAGDKPKADAPRARTTTSEAAGSTAARGARRTSSASGRKTPAAGTSNGDRATRRGVASKSGPKKAAQPSPEPGLTAAPSPAPPETLPTAGPSASDEGVEPAGAPSPADAAPTASEQPRAQGASSPAPAQSEHLGEGEAAPPSREATPSAPDDLLRAYRGESRAAQTPPEGTPHEPDDDVRGQSEASDSPLEVAPHEPDEDLRHYRAEAEAAETPRHAAPLEPGDDLGEDSDRAEESSRADDAGPEEEEDEEDDEDHEEEAAQAQPAAALPRTPSEEFRARAATAMVLGRELLAQAAESPAVARFLHAATGIARAVKSSLGVSSGTSLDAYGKDAQLERDLQPLVSFLLDKYWRVQVENAAVVPAGPAILVANHSGALPVDGPVLHHALVRARPDIPEPRWLVEDQVFYAPLLGTLLNRMGAVRASPENALRLLQAGRPVIVFPEGIQGIGKPFAERYRLMRFGRGGFVKIALRTRAPIIPVAIVGAEEASPLLGKLPGGWFGLPYLPITLPVPLPSRWMIRFGDVISVDDVPPEAARDLGVVQELTDRTRGSIQAMLTDLLDARVSAFV